LGLFDIDNEVVGVVATTVWELNSQVVFIFPLIQCISRSQRTMEVYTVPLGNVEALAKKKLENCIILSSHILLDHYTL
jgi:hypothetical protein